MSKVFTLFIHKLILVLLLFTVGSGLVYGQNLKEYTPSDVSNLKKQFYTAKDVESQVQVATELSSAYFFLYEIDSAKSYASVAINLLKTVEGSSRDDKYLLAKAIENYGTALSFTNATKAIDTLGASLSLYEKTGSKAGVASGYYAMAGAYSMGGNKIESIANFEKSLALHRELNNKAQEANILYLISLEKRYLGNFGDALEYSINSFKVAEEIQDTLLITTALLGNSFNYLLSKNYTEALQEQQKALRLFKLTKDSVGIATTYNDMGVTNMFADDLDKALKYHKMALDIRKKVDLSAVGISYNYVADVYQKQGKLKEALKYIKEGLPYSIALGDSRFIIEDYLLAGNIYAKLEDYNEAIANYNRAIEIAKANSNTAYQAEGLIRIGKVNIERGNATKALENLKLANKFVPLKDFDRRQAIYRKMMEVYEEQNDYKNAFRYQAKFQEMSDSVSAAVKAEKIATLTQELMYENKRAVQKASQAKEIALKESQIKTQKLIKNLSIAGLILILIFAVIFYIRFKEKRRLSQSLEKTLTDLKATQQQLIQSEKMASLGELTAGIAHEIQNPLNFVNNFSEVSNELLEEMKEEIEKGDHQEAMAIMTDVMQNLEKIHHHGKRADSIVKGMLQHSRASGNKKEPTDINALADEYLRLAYHGLRAKDKTFNAELVTDFDESIQSINVIAQDIGRVILNLVTNAFYAVHQKKQSNPTGYDPEVSISTKLRHNIIEIRVSDNGDGIPDPVKDKIFQPFFTTKPTGKGTGLGLSMSYDIITKGHGGKLSVETVNGKGAIFIIELPTE